MDETACFWQALPDKGFSQKGKQCKGGKKSKKRITVTFIVNAAGGKEGKPIVIWKSENPRCLKWFDKSLLPVEYYSQSKSWMSGEILESVLTKLNHRLASTSRKVLLLMDNAGCHPEDLKDKFSNIKIIFLPANTTSRLQPLDLGIIQSFKVHYRQMLLQYVLARIDQWDSATDVVKTVNILVAIRWVALAWVEVNSETILKCLRKAGILGTDMADVVACDSTEDPFVEADRCMELQSLINETMGVDSSCPANEYVNGDDDLPVCFELNDNDWEDNF